MIGDISGIVSGTATAVVVIQISHLLGYSDGSGVHIVLSVILTSLVAALTGAEKQSENIMPFIHQLKLSFARLK